MWFVLAYIYGHPFPFPFPSFSHADKVRACVTEHLFPFLSKAHKVASSRLLSLPRVYVPFDSDRYYTYLDSHTEYVDGM
jgi:hypothetical protein